MTLETLLKNVGYATGIIGKWGNGGPACNSNSHMEYFQSGGPFRCRKQWGKSSLHEGGIMMPFIVAWGSGLVPSVSNHIGMREDHDVSAEHPDIVARMWKMAESSHVEPSNHNPFFMMYIPCPDKK